MRFTLKTLRKRASVAHAEGRTTDYFALMELIERREAEQFAGEGATLP